jgi:hypothetical integral membrane protein (TIGR02206 family)
MVAVVTPFAYGLAVVVGLGGCVGACLAARRWPGRWTTVVCWVVGILLALDAGSFTVSLIVAGTWSAKTSLPLPLCDVAVLIAAVACFWRIPLLVELTYFWGLAGTLQGVLTPDLSVGFPHLVFWQYTVGHLGIVFAALFLVAGVGCKPRPRAVPRVFSVTLAYTAVVGLVDALTGANYMFLRAPPGEWTLLRVLGPWPWYLASAAGVALVLFTALDAPFWSGRRREAGRSAPRAGRDTGRPAMVTRPSLGAR